MIARAAPNAVLAGALTGALAGILVVGAWTLLATLLGTRDVSMQLDAGLVAGAAQGVVFVLLAAKGWRRPAALIAAAVGMALFLAMTRLAPFGLPPHDIVWSLGGLVVVFGGLAAMFESVMDELNLRTFGFVEAEILFLRALRGFGIAFFTLIVVFPFYVMIVASLKKQVELMLNPLDLSIDFGKSLPELLSSYIEALTRFRLARYIAISTLVSLATVVFTLMFAVPGAYAVARLRFPGRRALTASILIKYIFPPIVIVIPLYSVFSQLGLRDTLLGLLIVYPAGTLPVSLYMLYGYFRSLPAELEDAGQIDGCSRLGVILRITLPLSMPAIAAVALYIFMIAWNEFLFAFMFLDDPDIFTLSRGLVAMEAASVSREVLMAGAVLATLPVLVLFLWAERYMVSGLSAGGLKG